MDNGFWKEEACLDLVFAFLDEASIAKLAVVARALEAEFGVTYVQNPFDFH